MLNRAIQLAFVPVYLNKLLTTIMSRGKHAFVCFIGFSISFEYVHYWKLFSKLLDDNINCMIVRICLLVE